MISPYGQQQFYGPVEYSPNYTGGAMYGYNSPYGLYGQNPSWTLAESPYARLTNQPTQMSNTAIPNLSSFIQPMMVDMNSFMGNTSGIPKYPSFIGSTAMQNSNKPLYQSYNQYLDSVTPKQQSYGYPQQSYGYPQQSGFGFPQQLMSMQQPGYGYPQQSYGYPQQNNYNNCIVYNNYGQPAIMQQPVQQPVQQSNTLFASIMTIMTVFTSACNFNNNPQGLIMQNGFNYSG